MPPSASSKRPFFGALRAGERAPLVPNSSDSISDSGSAAQLTLMNGFFARGEL